MAPPTRPPRRGSDLETNVAPDALPHDPRNPEAARTPPSGDGAVDAEPEADEREIDRRAAAARPSC